MKEHVFSFFRKPAMTTVPYKSVGLVDVYRYIVGQYAAKQTAELRRITDEKEKKRYKAKEFDYCTFSGVFPFRKDSAMESHSGLLCVDIDKVADVQAVLRTLLSDPCFETMLLFTSPSGNGLKWVIEIDTKRASHRQWLEAVSRYLKATYGWKWIGLV